MRKLVAVISLSLGIGIIIAGNFMDNSWIKNAPTEKDEARGIIYPYNDHGRIVYLDLKQRTLFYGVPVVGLGVGALFWFVAERILEKKTKK